MKLPQEDQSQSNLFPFLQDSSLLTQMPPIVLSKADQKIVSPTKPVLAQLDSQGGICIKITIPAKVLRLGKLLGEGAYGSVYEGVWNEQPVAIKRLKAQHLTEKAIKELRQEAQIMFQLGVESKYIVPLKKICLEAPHYSLVMELMPKGSLYHLLHNGQDLPWTIRFQIALDAAWGLKDLHAYSILHRDLKSLNILLDDRLRAKLADFGLAKVKQETSSQSSLVKGTVLWMAPELFKRKAEVTAAADIWSLGMVLWELSTREIPFKDAQNQLQAMGWIKDGEKEEIPGDCPPRLKTIIESCWDLTSTKRPTASQVVEQLKPLLISQEQKAQRPVSTTKESRVLTLADPEDGEMKKFQAEVMQLKLKEAEDERQRVESEKMAEDHARLKAELEWGREIKRQEVELKKSPSAPKPEIPASSLPSLSQSHFTITPAPKSLIKVVDVKALEQLLRFVAEGEQNQAEDLIQKDQNLLLHAGTVTDLSGREFKQITAFQYALWAMDWHMWTMIQKYLSQEAQGQQLKELETKGTAYGQHFSLQGLTGALQTYVNNATKWNYNKQAEDQWCQEVGREQKLLPVHVVNEYCRNDRSGPWLSEWESRLPRTQKIETYTLARGTVSGSWFMSSSSEEGLGLTYAFIRDKYNVRGCKVWGLGGGGLGGGGGMVWVNLKALLSLWKTRTRQLELLQSKLLPTTSYYTQTLQLGQSSQPKLSSLEERNQHSPERLTLPEIKKPLISSKTELMTLASQNIYSLTAQKSGAKPVVSAKLLGQLLQWVAKGEQDDAEALIQGDRDLLLHAGTVTDLSGREFKEITAFQYALWAMDWHMWEMIRKYLPEEQQREQFEVLEKKGTVHGKHFSLQPLIKALQAYADNYDSFNWKMFESKREHHWQQVVVGAQKLLPVHVINEYFRPDRAFHPCPNFTEASLPRIRERGGILTYQISPYYAWSQGEKRVLVRGSDKDECWFVKKAVLDGEGNGWFNDVPRDARALQSLAKARIQQLELLASQLKLSSLRLGIG